MNFFMLLDLYLPLFCACSRLHADLSLFAQFRSDAFTGPRTTTESKNHSPEAYTLWRALAAATRAGT